VTLLKRFESELIFEESRASGARTESRPYIKLRRAAFPVGMPLRWHPGLRTSDEQAKDFKPPIKSLFITIGDDGDVLNGYALKRIWSAGRLFTRDSFFSNSLQLCAKVMAGGHFCVICTVFYSLNPFCGRISHIFDEGHGACAHICEKTA